MSTIVRSRITLAGLCLALAFGLLGRPFAQTPPAGAAQAGLPVAIDFAAVSADGQPVTDLKVEELSLKVDGKARIVHTLKFIQVPGQMSGSSKPVSALPAPFSTNSAADVGRSVIIVVDDESIRAGAERSAQAAVIGFLAGLSSQDRVALFRIPHGGMVVDFTSDLDKVRDAVAKIVGQAPETEQLSDAACRTRNDLQALTGILDSLGGGTGPVALVYVTASMTSSRSAITLSRTTPQRGGINSMGLPAANTVGTCELLPEEFEKVGAAAAQARAHFYVIRPELTAAPQFILPPGSGNNTVRGVDSIEQGIADLTGVTGGQQLSLGTGGDNPLIKVARETSSYYLVTFEPDDAERNGAPHKFDLRVSRQGVTLRTLPALVIPSHTVPTVGSAAPVSPRTMLGELQPYRDLAIRSMGITARDTNSAKVKIVAVFEPEDSLSTVTAAMAGLFDSTGKLVHSWTALPQDLSRHEVEGHAASPIVAALVAPPGKYRLRIAATDKAGRSGATDLDVDATLTPAGTLKLSSLSLGNTHDGIFVPKLQFTDESVAIAYVEVYGGVETSPVAVFQVAKTADGPAFLAQPAAIDPTRDPDRWVIEAAIPIGSLPPGDYVIRALIGQGVEGAPMGRVVRTLRKTSK